MPEDLVDEILQVMIDRLSPPELIGVKLVDESPGFPYHPSNHHVYLFKNASGRFFITGGSLSLKTWVSDEWVKEYGHEFKTVCTPIGKDDTNVGN